MKSLTSCFCATALVAFACVIGATHPAYGQQEPATTKAVAESPGVAPEVSPSGTPPRTIDRGDNAWMLTSSALVLLMTAPGLAMFYGGLVRKKNVLSVMMQCFFLMGLMTVIWVLYGYSLGFGASRDGWIGGGDFMFMKGVGAEFVTKETFQTRVDDAKKALDEEKEADKKTPLADKLKWAQDDLASVGDAPGKAEIPLHSVLNIPVATHMLFQLMFFIITPGLICGAYAERMKFSAMVVFSILWGTVVYLPLCHWVWGGGILAYGSDYAKTICAGGALDFAGGTVVHISSGVSALVAALLIGKRIGYGTEPMPPHNLTYTLLGAALLWVGWFGFNAGSAGAADGVAASAFTATHIAAAAATLSWAGYEWILKGKPTVLGAASGAVAGLVVITPAAGYVTPMPALVMGLAAGALCAFTSSTMKNKLGYDDSLDAFGVHGVGGTLGAILTGVFATRAIGSVALNGKLVTDPIGLFEGGPLLKAQIIATAITWIYAIVCTVVILKLVDIVIGLRPAQATEIQGLDVTQHGEEGYIFV
jgi:Amt family ammonium transporter